MILYRYYPHVALDGLYLWVSYVSPPRAEIIAMYNHYPCYNRIVAYGVDEDNLSEAQGKGI